ncbi:MAG: hypothetical protein AB7E77_08930 [Desulfobulbus sp.]
MEEAECIRMGAGPFIGNIIAKRLQSLEKDQRRFIFGHLLMAGCKAAIELKQAFIGNLPVEPKDGRFEEMGGRRFLKGGSNGLITFRGLQRKVFLKCLLALFTLGYLVLEYFEFTDIPFQELGNLITGNIRGRNNFFKIVEKGEKQFYRIRMGVGSFGTNIIPDLGQSLQVYLGDLVLLPQGPQVHDLIIKFLKDLVIDLPIQRKNNGFQPGQRGRFLAAEFEEVDILGIERLVGKERQVFEIFAGGICITLRFFHSTGSGVVVLKLEPLHKFFLDGNNC